MAENNIFGEQVLDSKDPTDDNSVLYKGDTIGAGSVPGEVEEAEPNECIPVGNIGQNADSLPSGSKVLSDYELVFKASTVKDRLWGYCKKGGTEVYVQKAYGYLTLNKVNNGVKEEIISVTAISGDGGNGCLPNNNYASGRNMKYFAGKIVYGTQFHDGNLYQNEKGEWVLKNKADGWKIFIYEGFANRGSFRIHPTPPSFNGEPTGNDGCISPYPAENAVAFHNEIIKILTKPNYVIPLFVDVEDNYNITVQLTSYANEKKN